MRNKKLAEKRGIPYMDDAHEVNAADYNRLVAALVNLGVVVDAILKADDARKKTPTILECIEYRLISAGIEEEDEDE